MVFIGVAKASRELNCQERTLQKKNKQNVCVFFCHKAEYISTTLLQWVLARGSGFLKNTFNPWCYVRHHFSNLSSRNELLKIVIVNALSVPDTSIPISKLFCQWRQLMYPYCSKLKVTSYCLYNIYVWNRKTEKEDYVWQVWCENCTFPITWNFGAYEDQNMISNTMKQQICGHFIIYSNWIPHASL